MVEVYIGIALITILVFVFYRYQNGPRNLPPGPVGLPFVGYLPFISPAKSHKQFNDLAKKYGPIFSMYLANHLVIVLNNYETIKEAFVRQGNVFSGRPLLNPTIDEPQYLAVTFADGDIWKTHRRFISNLLRDLGVGRMSIETLITDEIQHFLAEVQKSEGKSTDFSDLLKSSLCNNVCILVYGKRFEYDDPWFKTLRLLMIELITNLSAVNVFVFIPWMRHLPGIAKLVKQENMLQLVKDFQKSMHSKISDAKSKYIEGDKNSYINAFIGEQKIRKIKDKNDYDDKFSDNALIQNTRTMLVAGTETSTSTMMWVILCMIRYPEVQSQVQKEIDEIIGKDRAPCWNDRLLMPFTEATILEVQRFKTLVPLNVPHKNTEKCELFGYTIPKGTMIVTNLWAVHNDAKLWGDPEVFRPERFFTSGADKKQYVIPFSLGKRECLGISLAKMELFLYLTSMLQRFTFESADGSPPSLEEKIAGTMIPKYFITRAVLRNP